jgi:threonine dehydrogenase-like Zn-dependent dehydrogenase
MDEARILVLTGPKELEYLKTALPELGDDEVLVKSVASGISHGTEMNVYRGVAPQWSKAYDKDLRLFREVSGQDVPVPPRGYFTPSDSPWGYPMAYGYANVGRIVSVGGSVTEVQVDDLVYSYSPHQTAYVLPARNVIPLPPLDDPTVGVLYANMNTAYNGVLDTDFRIDDIVVVFGQGVVGLLVTQFLRHAGVREIITVDTMAKRRGLSSNMGAHLTLDPSTDDVAMTVRERTGNRGADVVIEASGSYGALQEAIRTAAPDTTVVVMSWYGGTGSALALSDEFHHNRITLKSSQTGSIDPALGATHSTQRRYQNVKEAFGYLDLESLISDRIPFDEALRGYELVDSRDENTTQVVFSYK